MKKFVYILMLLLCVGIVSCDDESNNDAMVVGIAERNADVTALGGTFTITLSAEADKVVSDQSWCVASISGKTVSLEVETNKGLEGRTALITVTKGTGSTSIPVTQPGNKIPVAQNESVEFNAHGGEMEVTVENVLPFEVTVPTDATWLNARVDKNKLILTTQNNYTLDRLSTTLTLKSGDLESELEVAQSGIVLIPEKNNLVMYNKGDETKIMVNSTLAFEAYSDQDWLTITPGEDFITLSAPNNSGQPLRTATVTLTSMGLTAEIEVTQRPTIYSDYLGSWTLIGDDGGTPIVYNMTIVQSVKDETFKVTGWGKSIVATDSQYAIEAVFDKATQYIYIAQQLDLGTYSDEGGDYTVSFRGLIPYNGGLSLVGGSFICYIGELQRDGSVQWVNNVINVGGQQYELVGSLYCITDAKGDVQNFKKDMPFMYAPIMQRASSMTYSAFSRSINSSKKVESFAVNNHLQVEN